MIVPSLICFLTKLTTSSSFWILANAISFYLFLSLCKHERNLYFLDRLSSNLLAEISSLLLERFKNKINKMMLKLTLIDSKKLMIFFSVRLLCQSLHLTQVSLYKHRRKLSRLCNYRVFVWRFHLSKQLERLLLEVESKADLPHHLESRGYCRLSDCIALCP